MSRRGLPHFTRISICSFLSVFFIFNLHFVTLKQLQLLRSVILPPIFPLVDMPGPIIIQMTSLAQRRQTVVRHIPVVMVMVQVGDGEHHLTAGYRMGAFVFRPAPFAAIPSSLQYPLPPLPPIRRIFRIIYHGDYQMKSFIFYLFSFFYFSAHYSLSLSGNILTHRL